MTQTELIVSGGDATALLADLPARIGVMVGTVLARTPDRIALVDEGGAWRCAELAEAIGEAAGFLTGLGLTAGGRALIVGGNGRPTAALLLAAWSLGACAVPVNPRLAPRELDEIAVHAAPSVVVYAQDRAPQVRAHADRRGAQTASLGWLGTIGFDAAAPSRSPAPDGFVDDGDIAALIYTSGTSGQPKGVMLTHRNLLYMAAVSGRIRRLTAADRLYLVLPLSHIVGLSVILLGGLMHGAVVQLAGQFNPRAVFRALQDEGVTILLGTPALLRLMLDYAGAQTVPPARSSSLRILSVSGAPLDHATKLAAEALFGIDLHHGYGITECAPTIAQIRPEAPRADCAVGPLLPGVEARLMGPDGPVAPHLTGELHIRGPNVMRGYFRAPEETARALDADGWFNTGDLAHFDGEPLQIVGRTKDLVIRYGFNVYPAEVEGVLLAHAAVQACAVIGRKSVGEEELIAFVQLRAESKLTIDELSRYASCQLASYKLPSHYILVEALPMTASGKVRKQDLALMAR